jgi:hypothetical protein
MAGEVRLVTPNLLMSRLVRPLQRKRRRRASAQLLLSH